MDMSKSGSTPELETSLPADAADAGLPSDHSRDAHESSEVNSPVADRSTVEDPAFLWLRRGDQLVVSLLVIALLGLLGAHWLRLSRWGSDSVELSSLEPREYYYSLDINTASWVEWTQLDGIGETLARRIIADREERGPFRNPVDVGRVKGIGPKLLEKILPFLRGGTESL